MNTKTKACAAYNPSKYIPDEIQNSMFLPLMQKPRMGRGIVGWLKNYSLVAIKYSVHPLISYAPRAEQILGGGGGIPIEIFLRSKFLQKNRMCPRWKKILDTPLLVWLSLNL